MRQAPEIKLTPGGLVWVRGQQLITGQYEDGLWNFTSKDGTYRPKFSSQAIRKLIRDDCFFSEPMRKALSPNVREALNTDWGSFTLAEQMTAQRKIPFVQAIDKLPRRERDKIKSIGPLIASTNAEAKDPFPEKELPTKRRVTDWYWKWVFAGRDIRALVDFLSARGNRQSRLEDWEVEEIDAAIDEVYNTEIRGSEGATWRRARDRILLRAKRDKLVISAYDEKKAGRKAKEVIGKNAVARLIAKREHFPIAVNRFSRSKANQQFRNLGAGPSGEYSLSAYEVDHTPLDLLVRHDDSDTILGRPWLTAIIDRWSRLIVGYYISFAPPSWLTVMAALRLAFLKKEKFLASMGGGFRFEWNCYGVPDKLFCDNGREFRSESMRMTQVVLNMPVYDVPRGRGDLKGKIERWLRKHNQELIHLLPGTSRSNPQDRGDYDSVANAVLRFSVVKRIVAIYVVDVYNQSRHTTTDEICAERWERGLQLGGGEKPPPPEELIAPLTGLVVRRKLRREGVRYNRLRWNSDDLQALMNRIGPSADVMVRIDPLDIKTAYVLDEDTDDWVSGDLISETEVEQYTLSQYDHLRKKLDDQHEYDPEHGLKMAQASQEIWDLVQSSQKSRGPIKKVDARFVTEGRKPAAHIHQDRHDPVESQRPLGSHEFSESGPKSAPPDARGPWRERVLPVVGQRPRPAAPDPAPSVPVHRGPPPNHPTPPVTGRRRPITSGA
jgi:putative transposase